MRHLAPLLTFALITGVAGGVLVDAPVTLAATVVMSAAWATCLLAYGSGQTRLQIAAFATIVVSAGWMLGGHAIERALHAPLRVLLDQRVGGFALGSAERRAEEPFTVEGRLLADVVATAEGTVVRLDVDRIWIHATAEPTSGGVSLGVSGTVDPALAARWTAGRRIRVPALLRRPARYLNDGVPDQERVLARRGISLVGSIKSAVLVEVIGDGRWWEELAAATRARTRTAIARHVHAHDEQSAAIATAILIGDRAGLSEETERRLQEAGTYHVIAISGGNIAILAGLLLGALALIGMRGRTAAVVAIAVLASYAIVAAGGPSVLRATAMAVVYLAVRLLDLRTAPANAMAITAGGIVVANPLQVLDVGFWFTFGATMALVLAATLSPPVHVMDAAFTKGTKGANGLSRLLAATTGTAWVVLAGTVCVELALAPVAAYVFQRVTVAGLLLNFVALPAMTVVQLGAMAVVAADLLDLSTLAGWLGGGVHAASVVLVGSARALDFAPWLTWRVPSPLPSLMVAYYACLALAVLAWRCRRAAPPAAVTPALPTLAALLLFLWIMIAPGARIRALGDGRLHVSMFDVGQGDSILVTFPNGRRLLVDTGGIPVGRFDIGDRVIGPALRAQGHLSLDYLAVTHADGDHIGGARALVRDFAPREVWWGIPVANHEPTERVRAEAGVQRTAWRTLQSGDRLDVGGVEVRVHHPPPEDWERQRVRNNDSLVIELRFGRVSVLLTGDIGREVEEVIAPGANLLPLVILKVPHHGSLTSSSRQFLHSVRPDVALVGVGRGNAYGHPAPHVLGRLTDLGTQVFRTDLDGQIDIVTNGQDVRAQTFTGRTHHLSDPERSFVPVVDVEATWR